MNESFLLHNSLKIPNIGFGTYGLGEMEDTTFCIEKAFEIGYRLIDTAPVYNNQTYIGQAITKYLRGGGEKRRSIYFK